MSNKRRAPTQQRKRLENEADSSLFSSIDLSLDKEKCQVNKVEDTAKQVENPKEDIPVVEKAKRKPKENSILFGEIDDDVDDIFKADLKPKPKKEAPKPNKISEEKKKETVKPSSTNIFSDFDDLDDDIFNIKSKSIKEEPKQPKKTEEPKLDLIDQSAKKERNKRYLIFISNFKFGLELKIFKIILVNLFDDLDDDEDIFATVTKKPSKSKNEQKKDSKMQDSIFDDPLNLFNN